TITSSRPATAVPPRQPSASAENLRLCTTCTPAAASRTASRLWPILSGQCSVTTVGTPSRSASRISHTQFATTLRPSSMAGARRCCTSTTSKAECARRMRGPMFSMSCPPSGPAGGMHRRVPVLRKLPRVDRAVHPPRPTLHSPRALSEDAMERERMEFDVLVVGAGPAGLAAAIRLAQRARKAGRTLSVCVLEKAPEPGAHTLSGAVMDPRGLDALLPGWRERAPAVTSTTEDEFLFLGETGARRVPHTLLPDCFRNEGNLIVRLGHLVKRLADEAE